MAFGPDQSHQPSTCTRHDCRRFRNEATCYVIKCWKRRDHLLGLWLFGGRLCRGSYHLRSCPRCWKRSGSCSYRQKLALLFHVHLCQLGFMKPDCDMATTSPRHPAPSLQRHRGWRSIKPSTESKEKRQKTKQEHDDRKVSSAKRASRLALGHAVDHHSGHEVLRL